MSVRISANLTDRDECRVVLEHVFYMHPGLRKEIADDDGEPTVAPKKTGEATKADPKIGVETDSRGVPWLEDVHAGTKGTNKDGSWKKKRGVDDAVIEAAEQKALAELAATPDPVIPDEGPTDALPPQGAPAGGLASLPGAGGGLPGAGLPGAGLPGADKMPGASAPPPVSYQDLVDLYSEKSNAGLIDADRYLAMLAEVGSNFEDLQVNETARAAMHAKMSAL